MENDHTYKNNPTDEDLIRSIADEEVLILRGHAIALLSPLDDDDLEWYIRERDPNFIESIARARKQVGDDNVTPVEYLKREFGIE